MKKNNLKNGLLATLVLVSGVVCADDQYPASDFQPTVVYQDETYISKSTSSATAEPAKAQSTAADDKYPAANFQPQVVYSDPDYKPSQSVSSSSSSASPAATTEVSAAPSDAKASDSTTTYWIGLIVMALGGVAFLKSRSCGKCATSTKAVASAPTSSSSGNTGGGVTGVSKYLNKMYGTGVSRYLEKHVQSVKAGAATGVEKYLRNRR